jgi:HEPN domain-containing protein
VAIKSAGAAQPPMRKTRKDFQQLAEIRAGEAASLAKVGRQQGAYYLGGFAVECALKACIAKKTKRYDFPADAKYAYKVYTHNLEELLKLAELDAELDRQVRLRPQLAINWAVVSRWNVDSRYEATGLNGKDMVAAVNSAEGVLRWIKLYW